MMLRTMLAVAVVALPTCAAAVPTPRAQSCIARYQACGLDPNKSMAEYLACRSAVDVDCLALDGGTHE